MQIPPGLAFREMNIPICHLNEPVTRSAIGFVLRLLSEGLRAPQELRLIRHVNLHCDHVPKIRRCSRGWALSCCAWNDGRATSTVACSLLGIARGIIASILATDLLCAGLIGRLLLPLLVSDNPVLCRPTRMRP